MICNQYLYVLIHVDDSRKWPKCITCSCRCLCSGENRGYMEVGVLEHVSSEKEVATGQKKM